MRSRRRMARSECLWCLAIFIALQLGIAVAIDRFWHRVRDPEYGSKLANLQARLAEPDAPPMVVMLGSSRTLNGLRPDQISTSSVRVFNFGLTSHAPVNQLLALRRLLGDGVVPQGLVIEVAPILLAETNSPIHLERQKWSDLKNVWRVRGQQFATLLNWAEQRIIPIFSYRFALMSRYRPNWLTWEQRKDGFWTQTDQSGWYPHHQIADKQAQAIERARLSYQSVLQLFQIDLTQDRALREMLTIAQEQKIPVSLVLMPEGPIFQSWYSDDSQSRIRHYLEKVSRDYSVPVFDARNWISDESAFMDSHHLSPEGATLFTKRFATEVLSGFRVSEALTLQGEAFPSPLSR